LYSRKFNGIGVLPPDYSGVALRHPTRADAPKPCDSSDDSDQLRPHRPIFERDPDEPKASRDEPTYDRTSASDNCTKDTKPESASSSFFSRSFSSEDIMLAGLLLLLLNEEKADSSLLIILGLLLLAGM